MLAIARPRDDLHVRIEAAYQLGGLRADLWVIGCDDEQFGLLDLGRAEDFRAQGVAIEDRHAPEATGQLDGLDLGVQGHERHPLGAQDPRDDLPHTAHAGDHHTRGIAVDVLVLGWNDLRQRFGLDQSRHQQHQQGCDSHRQGDGEHQKAVHARLEQALIPPHLEHHEGELAPRRQDDAQAQGTLCAEATGQPANQKQQRQLQHNQ